MTGAAGGVGSVAIALLAALGHRVDRIDRPAGGARLPALARRRGHRRAREPGSGTREAARHASAGPAAIDAVGGDTLATVLTQLRYGASVAAVGLAGGSELHATVLPFLLRGVNLLGIDSVMCPAEPRARAWERLARTLKMDRLDAMTEVIGLADLPEYGRRILAGQHARARRRGAGEVIGAAGGRDRDRTCDPRDVNTVLYR